MQKPQTLEGAAGAKITRMGGCRNPNPQMSKTLKEQLVQVGVGGAETQTLQGVAGAKIQGVGVGAGTPNPKRSSWQKPKP